MFHLPRVHEKPYINSLVYRCPITLCAIAIFYFQIASLNFSPSVVVVFAVSRFVESSLSQVVSLCCGVSHFGSIVCVHANMWTKRFQWLFLVSTKLCQKKQKQQQNFPPTHVEKSLRVYVGCTCTILVALSSIKKISKKKAKRCKKKMKEKAAPQKQKKGREEKKFRSAYIFFSPSTELYPLLA